MRRLVNITGTRDDWAIGYRGWRGSWQEGK